MSELDPRFTADVRETIGDVHLRDDTVFFAKSDKAGKIVAACEGFVRACGRPLEDVVGQPFSMLRHPDVPRGVFHAFWERLKSGASACCYIRNADYRGRGGWALLCALPSKNGYLGIYLTANAHTFAEITPLYEDLVDRERGGATAQDSARSFIAGLRDLGYSDLPAFQSCALAAEYECRMAALKSDLPTAQKNLRVMAGSIDDVQAETAEMTEAFNDIRTVPMNMRIIASRLENAGGPISAISVNYSQMLDDMSAWVHTFVEGEECAFERIRQKIQAAQFNGFASKLLFDLGAQSHHQAEGDAATQGLLEEIAALEPVFRDETRDALQNLEVESVRFGRSVLDMKRYVTGLSSTRMMCKIESAALSERGTALGGIVEQLDHCQTEIEKRLNRIVELNGLVESNTAMLRATY